MSNKAITKNDLAAVLNEVLPPTPSEYRKLLWTNPSPTSSFAAQTINLDLSSYDTIEVHFKTSTTSAYTQYVLADIGKSSKYLNRDNNANSFYVRAFSTTTSSVQFDSGYYQGTANDIYGIPLNIYGIKYERVAPPQEGFNIIVVTDSATQSVPVGSGTFYITPTIPSGYQALCVAGFSVQYAECSVNMCYWDGTRVVLQIRNNYTTTLNVAVSVFLLCCTSLT